VPASSDKWRLLWGNESARGERKNPPPDWLKHEGKRKKTLEAEEGKGEGNPWRTKKELFQ